MKCGKFQPNRNHFWGRNELVIFYSNFAEILSYIVLLSEYQRGVEWLYTQWTNSSNVLHIIKLFERMLDKMLMIVSIWNLTGMPKVIVKFQSDWKSINPNPRLQDFTRYHDKTSIRLVTQIAKFMGPTRGQPGSCRPRWAPCWPHGSCNQGNRGLETLSPFRCDPHPQYSMDRMLIYHLR